MISSFDLIKLNALLKDFYTLTQIRITVFDENFNELTAYPPLNTPFCQLIRSDSNAANSCHICDKKACTIAAKKHSIHTYKCHAGLTEAITPLYLGNMLIGYLFFGQVFSYDTREEGFENIKKCCSSYNIDIQKLKSSLASAPLLSAQYIFSASHILQAVANYLCMERIVDLKKDSLPVQINEYIVKHYTENITVINICEYFNIGKTRLYEISKQIYGTGIAEHIRTLRIQKAQSLLLDDPSLTLREISLQCGFNDYNYFITVFKQITGTTPKAFYKNSSKN